MDNKSQENCPEIANEAKKNGKQSIFTVSNTTKAQKKIGLILVLKEKIYMA